MNNALLQFEATHPSHIDAITTHMFRHMPDYVEKWGPIKGSWAMWSERMVRDVRDASAVENRTVVSLGNAFVRWRNAKSPRIVERPEVTEWCDTHV